MENSFYKKKRKAGKKNFKGKRGDNAYKNTKMHKTIEFPLTTDDIVENVLNNLSKVNMYNKTLNEYYEGYSMDRNWELYDFLLENMGAEELLLSLSKGMESLAMNFLLHSIAKDYEFDLEELGIPDGKV